MDENLPAKIAVLFIVCWVFAQLVGWTWVGAVFTVLLGIGILQRNGLL